MAKHVLTVESHADGALVIGMNGDFNSIAANALLRTVAIAASTGVSRLELDLRGVTESSAEGLHAVTSCRRLSTRFPQGVCFRVSRLGRDLLLASVSADPLPVAAALASA
ncbi:MAG: hypothetical protein ABIM89_14760 [Mycobacteriales bacterium]